MHAVRLVRNRQSGPGNLDSNVHWYCNTRSWCELLYMEGGMMEEKVERKPVTSTLREMRINEQVSFPIDQKDTVKNTICGRLDKERREGRNWSAITMRDEGIILVTSTA